MPNFNCLLCWFQILICFLVQIVLYFSFSFVLMALSILSLNCNGIRDRSKRTGLVQWLRSLSLVVDVVCLQETHCVSQIECDLWFSSSGFSSCLSSGSNHSCGCIILYRPLLSFVGSWVDTVGHYLQCEFFFTANLFVFAVFMPRTITLNVTSSLMMFLTRSILLSPPFLWVTLTPYLIG